MADDCFAVVDFMQNPQTTLERGWALPTQYGLRQVCFTGRDTFGAAVTTSFAKRLCFRVFLTLFFTICTNLDTKGAHIF